MGFLDRLQGGEKSSEPSFSRQWLAASEIPRKVELSFAVVARIGLHPACRSELHGLPLAGELLNETSSIVRDVVRQDRSLLPHVSRDTVLFFEAYGGIFMHRDSALDLMGGVDALDDVAHDALTIASVIQARSQGHDASADGVHRYTTHFENPTDRNVDRAASIAAWAATALGRLRAAGHLAGSAFQYDGREYPRSMDGVGWYPNPVNAGDTSGGDAQIERWWNGEDWTDRVRIREGRRWSELQNSLFVAPKN